MSSNARSRNKFFSWFQVSCDASSVCTHVRKWSITLTSPVDRNKGVLNEVNHEEFLTNLLLVISCESQTEGWRIELRLFPSGSPKMPASFQKQLDGCQNFHLSQHWGVLPTQQCDQCVLQDRNDSSSCRIRCSWILFAYVCLVFHPHLPLFFRATISLSMD